LFLGCFWWALKAFHGAIATNDRLIDYKYITYDAFYMIEGNIDDLHKDILYITFN
jgi:hypothetical protein